MILGLPESDCTIRVVYLGEVKLNVGNFIQEFNVVILHNIALRKPELPELMERVCVDAGVKWHAMGLQLGIPNGQLQMIENDCRGRVQECCREMFDTWLSTNPDATWRRLIQVLCTAAVGKNVLAKQLCEWLEAPFPH